jgi:hypothetical protein
VIRLLRVITTFKDQTLTKVKRARLLSRINQIKFLRELAIPVYSLILLNQIEKNIFPRNFCKVAHVTNMQRAGIDC